MIFARSIRAPSVTRICGPHDLTPDLDFRLEARRGVRDIVMPKQYRDLNRAEMDAALMIEQDEWIDYVAVVSSTGQEISRVTP